MTWLRRAAQALTALLYLLFLADCGLLIYSLGSGGSTDTGGEIGGGASLIVILLLIAGLRIVRERWLGNPPNYL